MVVTGEAISVSITVMATNVSETGHTGIVVEVQEQENNSQSISLFSLFYLDRHFSSAAQRREYMWALWMYVEA